MHTLETLKHLQDKGARDHLSYARAFWTADTEFPHGKPGTKEQSVDAWIKQGHWVVDCPDCPNNMYVSKTGLFLCSACGNFATEGHSRPVRFPANRKQIEAVLHARPAVFRNWRAGESVGDLAAENLAHGFPAVTE